jgi:hypothetical protein
MLLCYRWRCVSLLGRRHCRHGHRYLDDLWRRWVECLDYPVHGKMGKNNNH